MPLEDKCIYFEFQGSRKVQVSREQWERGWLRWWKKTVEEDNEEADK